MLAALVMLASLAGTATTASAQTTPAASQTAPAHASSTGVTIPNLWDPNRRLDKPPTTSLTGIRFTTTDDFPPYNFKSPDGRLTGFNVDLARAICRELSVPCTIQARPWDGLIETVAAGRVDAALAGIAITPETRAKLDFSDVYLRPAARFVARKGGPVTRLETGALAGRKVAVAKGSAHEAYLAAFFPEATAVAVDTPAAGNDALKAGTVDLVFGDGVQLAFWLQSEPAANCCAFVGGAYVEPRFFGPGLAIALPPNRADLRLALNWALDSLYDKGAFAELYLRYFPVGYF
ncbi:transporter substrate-binding domain-containing protein [Kaistia granuli]|uniref:transporter substrate-binding domain-containing protein n=1 Tax=Kaistia granuli TaxID=363259 RepID=UPI000365FAD9|nr:transporter substrate-binding domain-containing protein [Kaistia granuli]